MLGLVARPTVMGVAYGMGAGVTAMTALAMGPFENVQMFYQASAVVLPTAAATIEGGAYGAVEAVRERVVNRGWSLKNPSQLPPSLLSVWHAVCHERSTWTTGPWSRRPLRWTRSCKSSNEI